MALVRRYLEIEVDDSLAFNFEAMVLILAGYNYQLRANNYAKLSLDFECLPKPGYAGSFPEEPTDVMHWIGADETRVDQNTG